MNRLRMLYSISLLSFAASANANWEVRVDDDLFAGGQKASMIVMMDRYQALAFDCNAEHLEMSVIEKGKYSEGMELERVRVLVKVDNSELIEFPMKITQRNADYLGILTADRERLIPLVKQVRDAKSKIQIGIEFTNAGKQWSSTVPIYGSTDAANRFMKACNID